MLSQSEVYNAIQADLNSLENKRKSLLSQYIVYYLCFALSLYLAWYVPKNWWLSLPALLAIYAIYKLNLCQVTKSELQTYYKKEVLAKALHLYKPDLHFEPKKGISIQEFNNSQLFNRKPDKYSSEDYMEAQSGKTAFYVSEIRSQYKTETYSKHGKQTQWHELFNGLLFVADFNKHFEGITLLRPKDFGYKFSKFTGLSYLFNDNESEVKLENPEFTKTFVCYSSDQVEARYILTPKLMDEILALNSKLKQTISLSFVYSKVYIAIPLSQNYFDLNILRSALKSEQVERDLQIIDFIFQIIEDLDLNTRIWTKA